MQTNQKIMSAHSTMSTPSTYQDLPTDIHFHIAEFILQPQFIRGLRKCWTLQQHKLCDKEDIIHYINKIAKYTPYRTSDIPIQVFSKETSNILLDITKIHIHYIQYRDEVRSTRDDLYRKLFEDINISPKQLYMIVHVLDKDINLPFFQEKEVFKERYFYMHHIIQIISRKLSYNLEDIRLDIKNALLQEKERLYTYIQYMIIHVIPSENICK